MAFGCLQARLELKLDTGSLLDGSGGKAWQMPPESLEKSSPGLPFWTTRGHDAALVGESGPPWGHNCRQEVL